MTTFDLAPIYRASVGFDRLFRLLDSMGTMEEWPVGYPSYDIEETGDDAYRITLSVAGFGEDELKVEARKNELVVTGEHTDVERTDKSNGHGYLHRGIAGRAFRRSFRLADDVEVVGARLENGLLHIDLVREVPEAKKPRRIEISTSAPAGIVAKAKKLVSSLKKAA